MDVTRNPETTAQAPSSVPSGRGPLQDGPAVVRAREYGIDITLLEAMLELSVEERLRRLDAAAASVRALGPAREQKP
jgi:hypothetical protein